ncbi:MAG TPA: molybdopterin biosynthesis protein [Minicystis sp.]|nr:molybdopterin biosynthesis protein [Minicystis sp.]
MKQDQFLHVLSRDDAERAFRAALGELAPLGVERVALAEALGRVLAEDVKSPVDVPGFDRANMDGFAVVAEDTFGADEQRPARLRVLDEAVEMGKAPASAVTRGAAMAIPTGGVVPRGADAVVMVEHTRLDGDDVLVEKPVTPGKNVTYAGTDVAQGETVLRARDVLGARETGLIAAMGVADVAVFRRPRVAVLSTGDEIVEPGSPAGPGRIHDANRRLVADAVRECGAEPVDLGIAPDDLDVVKTRIALAVADADAVLLSGGTSKGPGDLNVRALEAALGPDAVVAHGVALKPGKPLCLAVKDGKPVVVLPGFPTSAIFTFHEFVAPVLRALAGRDESARERLSARLPVRMASEIGRTEYTLVRLTEDDAGALVAYPVGKGSGSVTTFGQADGYFVVPRDVELLDAGDEVEVLALSGASARRADLVVIGSHCLGLDLVIGRLRRRGVRTKLIAVGSEGGLAAVRRGECDLAGMHLFDPESGQYNAPFLTPELELVRGYGRLQGVVFRRGDARFEGKDAPGAVREAAADPSVVMINRNRGSGTRALVDGLLGGSRPAGYGVEASSHHAIAAAVAQGRADFGVAIDVVAKSRGLGFLPLVEERFDFVVRQARRARPAVEAFVDELARASTRAALAEMGFSP